jgi:hypothetical protein
MIDVVQIENALDRINGDIFQEFCNHYLYLKLNPNTITPIGSVIGKEKSRKGIPDSYFTSADNKLIFAEYTTRKRLKKGENLYTKLESDIENCFDTSKTGLRKYEVDKVILCFTERIKPEEKKKLEDLCKRHNPKCILELKGIRDLAFAVLDYPILGTYIGIKVGTGQIQEPSEFIANYEKNRISTPLSNIFFGRENELEGGMNQLDKNDLLLVHGAPGTGKSKFAIELAKQYSYKNGFSFLCIGNKGLPIWDDIKLSIRKDKKYILLVDDANRIAKNFQWILSLFEDRNSNTLKVIVTVRDYALSHVKSIAVNYSYSTINIGAFSNDEIKNIIQSDDFKIKDSSYVDRIVKIAQGNARLAIMSAKVACKVKNIFELNDVSQIYDEYFETLFNEVELLKEPIVQKSLALISFFSCIDKSNRKLCDFIFESLNIEENKFWEICYLLHESELVDLYEQQVVKISDQIFATYIFYKAVIDNEILSFGFFVNNYLNYKNRITDAIVPAINTFNYKQIEIKLKPVIINKWLDIESDGDFQKSLEYLDLFWFYLSPQVLIFIKKQIDKQEAETSAEYRYSYELNEFSCGTGKYLEILSRFRVLSDEFFKDALELMFYYAIKVPSKMPAVIYNIKEKFSFARLGYMYGDRIQHLLFDFLITNAQCSSNKIIYENVLTEILPDFLKLKYNENEGNGRSITFWTFQLWLSNSIKSFRTKCFNYLLENANKSIILQTMFRLNYYEYIDSSDVLHYDLQYIYQIINNHFDLNKFEDCFVLQNVLEGLDLIKVDYSKEINSEYNSKLYQLAEVLKSDRQRKRELGWEEEERLHKEELLIYCDGFNIDDYDFLFSNVSLILEQVNFVSRGNLEWQYKRSLDVIFGNIARLNTNIFLDVLDINIRKTKLDLNYIYIFNHFFQATPNLYFELFEQIRNLEVNIKLSYHQALDITFVKYDHLTLFYSDLLTSIKSLKSKYVFWDLTFVSKYKELKKEEDIYSEILDIIIIKIKNEQVKISVGEDFIEKCILMNDISVEILTEIYLYTSSIEQCFDYKKEILKKLILLNPNVIIQFLEFNLQKNISYHDLEHENFDFIWELNNYCDIVDSIFDYFISSDSYFYYERYIAAFFPQSIDKCNNMPIEYLKNILEKKYQEDQYLEVIFSIISYRYPKLKMQFLKNVLMLNNSMDVFRSLEIIPRSRSWSGSHIPILEGEKKTWSEVLEVIESLPNRMDFYEHKEFVSRCIAGCNLSIKDEMKREFIEDFR